MPKGATYIYNLNFFCGFLVSSGSYWILCHHFPIPATSDHWHEVGNEIGDISVAYNREQSFDEESISGSEHFKAEDEGTRDRKAHKL